MLLLLLLLLLLPVGQAYGEVEVKVRGRRIQRRRRQLLANFLRLLLGDGVLSRNRSPAGTVRGGVYAAAQKLLLDVGVPVVLYLVVRSSRQPPGDQRPPESPQKIAD